MRAHATHMSRAKAAAKPAAAARAPSRHTAVRSILRGSAVQPKLSVGAVNDPAEREADRVADQVMRMPATGLGAPIAPPPSRPGSYKPQSFVRRKCAACAAAGAKASKEETDLGGTIHRLCPDCEAERQKAEGAGAEGGDVGPGVEAALASLGSGRPLPEGERAFFEPRFGLALSDVRIHDGAEADRAARSIHARAFALRGSIAFAAGEYRPGTMAGRRLIAHELAHVTAQEDGLARRQPVLGYYGYGYYPYYGYFGGSGGHPCPATAATPSALFCVPFPSRADALADRDSPYLGTSTTKGVYILAGAVAAAAGSPVALRLYFKFIYGGSSSVENVNDGAADFTGHATSAFVTTMLLNDVLAGIIANRDMIYSGFAASPGAHMDVPVDPRAQRDVDDQSSAYALNFCGLNLPGVIAGGVGKTQATDRRGADTSAAQNDSRNVNGDFRVTATIQSPARLTMHVAPRLTYHVVDTVDFCPGNPGGFFAEFLTLPMSRWEASGISGDVTFELDFPAPSLTGSVELTDTGGGIVAGSPSVS
jgi:Domain of unknown function (DUF4157)